MKVAIYARQSLDKAGDGLGVARQISECRRLCEYRQWQVAQVIEDNDRSATYGKRPGYEQLKRLIRSREIEAVVVLRMDRLLRRMTELEQLIDLCEETGATIATVEGDVNLHTPMGRQIARIMASVARGEVEVKSARHRLANEQRARAGRPHAGRRAYGYETDGVTIIEDEALMLKEIGERFLNGYSYTELAMFLNERGARTTMGNQFIGVAVKQLLSRKRYVGIREYNGQEFPGNWTPIFDPETWQRIQLRIRERSENFTGKPSARRHLLTGLLICGRCGTPLIGSRTRNRHNDEYRSIYRCRHQPRRTPEDRGCGKVTRDAVALEWFIKEAVCYRLDSPELSKLIAGESARGQVEGLLKRRAALEAKAASLLDDYTDELLTRSEYKRAKERTTAALAAVGERLSALHRSETLDGLLLAGESVRSRWESESDGWQRQLVDLLVESITVNQGRKLPRVQIDGRTHYFDSRLIDITWRC